MIFFFFLQPHLWHTEVPRLGVKLELQLPAYATDTAMWALSHVCNLHQSSQQRWIFNPLSEARDRTHILMDTSRIRLHCATMGMASLCSNGTIEFEVLGFVSKAFSVGQFP